MFKIFWKILKKYVSILYSVIPASKSSKIQRQLNHHSIFSTRDLCCLRNSLSQHKITEDKLCSKVEENMLNRLSKVNTMETGELDDKFNNHWFMSHTLRSRTRKHFLKILKHSLQTKNTAKCTEYLETLKWTV